MKAISNVIATKDNGEFQGHLAWIMQLVNQFQTQQQVLKHLQLWINPLCFESAGKLYIRTANLRPALQISRLERHILQILKTSQQTPYCELFAKLTRMHQDVDRAVLVKVIGEMITLEFIITDLRPSLHRENMLEELIGKLEGTECSQPQLSKLRTVKSQLEGLRDLACNQRDEAIVSLTKQMRLIVVADHYIQHPVQGVPVTTAPELLDFINNYAEKYLQRFRQKREYHQLLPLAHLLEVQRGIGEVAWALPTNYDDLIGNGLVYNYDVDPCRVWALLSEMPQEYSAYYPANIQIMPEFELCIGTTPLENLNQLILQDLYIGICDRPKDRLFVYSKSLHREVIFVLGAPVKCSQLSPLAKLLVAVSISSFQSIEKVRGYDEVTPYSSALDSWSVQCFRKASYTQKTALFTSENADQSQSQSQSQSQPQAIGNDGLNKLCIELSERLMKIDEELIALSMQMLKSSGCLHLKEQIALYVTVQTTHIFCEDSMSRTNFFKSKSESSTYKKLYQAYRGQWTACMDSQFFSFLKLSGVLPRAVEGLTMALDRRDGCLREFYNAILTAQVGYPYIEELMNSLLHSVYNGLDERPAFEERVLGLALHLERESLVEQDGGFVAWML